MGAAWADRYPVAKETFAEADDILGFSLSLLCWQGPQEELGLTENTQPALLATSIAIYRAIAAEIGLPVLVAGHSLGEYSALVAAGALQFADALRLVKNRGRFMQEAVPAGQGAMAAVLGLDAESVAEIAAEATDGDEICAVANLNAPSQTVVAGLKIAVERAIDLAKQRGARRAVLLPVSAPFHSPLMAPARERLTPLLEGVEFRDPEVPVVANVSAEAVRLGAELRTGLVRQVDAPVRWVESIQNMRSRFAVEEFVEVGPGSVLCGLVRRIDRGATTISLSEPERYDSWRQSEQSEQETS